MNRTSTLLKLIITNLVMLIPIWQGNAQDSLIHNTDKSTLVNFSEALEYLHEFGETRPEGKVYNITLNNFGYLLIVKSLGEYRYISVEKKEFLDYVFKTIGVYDKAKDLFNNEVLVETDAGNYWFPIQDELLGYWHDELKEGDLTLIYIRFYGSMSENSDDKWIFTINGFNSSYYDGLWEEALNNFNNKKDTIGLRCVKKLISLDPDDGRNYAMLGFYYTLTGEQNSNDQSVFTKADSLFSIAEKLTPGYSYQYFQRAILKFYMNDYIQSWSYIEKARSMNEVGIEQFFIDDLESKFPYKDFLQTKK